MPRKSKNTAVNLEKEREPSAELLATLPADRAGLLGVAMSAVYDINRAIVEGNVPALAVAGDLYSAVIWRLNGGTFFGANADEDAGGCLVERHCAAEPGRPPMWGQAGTWLVDVDGMLAVVDYGPWWGGSGDWLRAHFELHAVDLDRPFVSETGYRSHFTSGVMGQSVDQCARAALTKLSAAPKGSRHLTADAQARLAQRPVPPWLAKAHRSAWREATTVVPRGFVAVDAVLPAQKAWIVRRWADEAAAKIKAMQSDQTPRKSTRARAKRTADGGDDSSGEGEPSPRGDDIHFAPGMRCRVVAVHHQVFAKEIGKRIVVTRVHEATRQLWAHEDKPTTYRTTRSGRRVVDVDPKCIESLYGFDQIALA